MEAAAASSQQYRVLRPVKRRILLSELWTAWPVTRLIAMRDLRIKYKQSILGPLWLFLQPLGLLAGLLVAFAGVTKAGTQGAPAALFMIVGVAVWTFVQQSMGFGVSALLTSGSLVRRSSCPRTPLVLGTVLANLPSLLVMSGVGLVWSLLWEGPRVQMLVIPLLAVWLAALVLGPLLAMAALATRFRDAIAVIPMLMQAGAFVSPVGYSIQSAPAGLEAALWANPMTGMLEAWRWAVLGISPVGGAIAVCAAETIVLVLGGWWVFARLETRLADFL